MSCEQACCTLLRGKVYIQAEGESRPRLVGNSSRLTVSQTISTLVPLDGAASICDPIEEMKISLSMKCSDVKNLKLSLHGNLTNNTSVEVVDSITLPDVLEPGMLLSFSKIADIPTIAVSHDWLYTNTSAKFREGIEYVKTSIGLEVIRCVTVPTLSPTNKTITTTYKSLQSTRIDVGEGTQPDVKLIYSGANQFDGSLAILTIPKVRFDPMESIDFINDAEIDLTINGDIIQQQLSPKWYSLTRPSAEC